MASVQLSFRVLDMRSGEGRGERFTQEVIKVGTFPTAHLRLEDPSVAGMHAYIHVKGPDEIYISDLGSPRGTIVNGQKVNKARLKSGDEIIIGQTKLVVEVGQVQAQPVAGAPAAGMGAPAATPGAVPGAAPGMAPGAMPGMAPGMAPGAMPGMAPGAVPGMAPGAVPGMAPGAVPGMAPQPAEPAFQPVELTSQDIEEVEAPGQAVEIQARYGGSTWKVVDVTDPKGGKPKPATLGLLGLGVVGLLAGVAMFGVALWQIEKQKEHRERVRKFLKARGLSEKYVPKVRGNPVLSGGALAGVVVGMSLFLWGLARYKEESESPDFTVGSDPKAKFHLSEELLPKGMYRYPLVKAEAGGFKIQFWDGVEGEVEYEDGQKVSLAELVQQGQARPADGVPGYAFEVPQNGVVRLRVGDAEFEVKVVRPGRKIGGSGDHEWRTWWYYGGSFAAHALFMLLLFGMPSESGSMESDTLESASRFGKIAREVVRNQQKELEAKQQEEKKPEKVKPSKEKIKTDQKGSGPVDERIKRKGAGGPPSPIKTSLRVSMARGAGMLGVLGRMSGKALASVFGREAAVSSDAENALGSLVGHTVGDAYGLGGLGLGGGGRGGGGSGAGGIGLGAWGVGPGGGSGARGGFGPGGVSGYRIGRSRRGPLVTFRGVVSMEGPLDKSIIRRVIRRHLNEIRYCYVSRGLATNPKLQGQVKVQFVINTMGRVSSVAIAYTSLNHPATEACIKAAIRRWRFPKPEGGIVVVRYPFNFKPGGV